jgi:MGT family glycosyltransferase
MSTALVLNLPEHGHMNATFPVVAELAARGERVIYYATEPYRRKIEETGAEFSSYGASKVFEPPQHTGGLYSVMAYLMGLAEFVLPVVLDRLESDPPDYLLIDSMCVWGRLAQQLVDLPAVTLGSVFVPNDSVISVEEMLNQAYGRAPKEVLLAGIDALNTYLQVSQRIDRRYGTRSPNIVEFFANRQALNVIFTSREFHPMGHNYDDTYRFTGPSIAARSEDTSLWLDEGSAEPIIYISLGTIFNSLPHFFRACIEAFDGSQYRVVMATGSKVNPEVLGPIPANFTISEHVPQLAVLERSSLFITHCGMNSTSEALWHGVPMLGFPQHGDQHLVAGRVAELGAGLTLRPPDIQPKRIRELAELVLSEPKFRENASRVRASFRASGGYRRAAAEILSHVRGTRQECLQSA